MTWDPNGVDNGHARAHATATLSIAWISLLVIHAPTTHTPRGPVLKLHYTVLVLPVGGLVCRHLRRAAPSPTLTYNTIPFWVFPTKPLPTLPRP
jgi:hypothetical protein